MLSSKASESSRSAGSRASRSFLACAGMPAFVTLVFVAPPTAHILAAPAEAEGRLAAWSRLSSRPVGGTSSTWVISAGRTWNSALPGGEQASARQLLDGRILIRATSTAAVERARFMLAVDDDHSEFVLRFRTDPLLGRTVRALPGLRPHRVATVAHALLRGICGQLIQSSRARRLERVILSAAGTRAPEQADLARFAPVQLRALGLATERAAALVRVCRTLDLERLRNVPT